VKGEGQGFGKEGEGGEENGEDLRGIGKGKNRRGRYGRGWKGEEEEERGGRDFANNNPPL
jgi:hypothetical protein